MGDVAMTVPVLYSLIQQYPDLQITIVSRAAFQPFFEQLPPNITFFAADLYGKHKGLRGLFRLYRELYHLKIDAVADLHNVLRTFFLRWCFKLSGIPVEHLNKGRKEKKALTRQKNKIRQAISTTFERYTSVFNKLGLLFPCTFTNIFDVPALPPPELLAYTGEKGSQRWIGIAPFAKHPGKMYPLEKMEEVIEQLSQRDNHRIFLFGGGPQELETLQQWEKKYAHTQLSTPLKLAGELALINQLDVMISMDSANMHMASLTQTPVISIWGATHPWGGFMGWNQSIENAIQLDMPCRPCSIFGHKPCLKGNYACMQGIEPERIVKQVDLLLRQSATDCPGQKTTRTYPSTHL